MQRHIFIIFAMIMGMVFCAPSVSASALYAVNGVNVDVTAGNALAAREEAFEAAQVKAFDALAKKMVAEDQIKAVKKPGLKLISRMIQDFEVTNEKLSDVRYVGTYNFRFNERNVKQYFNIGGSASRNGGVAHTSVGARPVLILPFFQGSRDTWLWASQNFWRQAWSRQGNMRGAVPLRIPVGDLDDIQDIKDRDLFDYDQGRMDNMLKRYGAREAILVVGSADTDFLSIANGGDIARGKFTAHIYRTDRRGPEYVSNVVVEARAPETRAQMLTRAVKKVHRALQQDWKTKTATAPSAAQNKLSAVTQFTSLAEWARLQKTLERLSGVDAVNVQSLSPAQATLEVVYRGSEERLRVVLEQARLVLSPAGGAYYNLSFR